MIVFFPLFLFRLVVARGRFSLPAPSAPRDRHVWYFVLLFFWMIISRLCIGVYTLDQFSNMHHAILSLCAVGTLSCNCWYAFACCIWTASLCLSGECIWYWTYLFKFLKFLNYVNRLFGNPISKLPFDETSLIRLAVCLAIKIEVCFCLYFFQGCESLSISFV